MTQFGYTMMCEQSRPDQLVQIGADQQERFTTWAERELLPALRSL